MSTAIANQEHANLPRIAQEGLLFDNSLSQHQVDETIRYFTRVFANQPVNTLLACDSDLIIYRTFCEQTNRSMVSNDTKVMRDSVWEFFEKQVNNGNSKYTIARRLNTISLMLDVVGVFNPVSQDQLFRQHKANVFKTLSGVQKQAAPIDGDLLSLINETYIPERLVDQRDLAMVNVMFDGLLRRSEIMKMRLMDIDRKANSLFLPDSKTDKDKKGTHRFISDTSIAMIDDFVSEFPAGTFLDHEYLWRPMSPKGTSLIQVRDGEQPKPLSPRAINKFISRVITKTLGDTEKAKGFSSHSLRVGMAIEMAKNNVPTNKIAEAGGWKSEAMVLKYIRHLLPSQSGAADVAKVLGR